MGFIIMSGMSVFEQFYTRTAPVDPLNMETTYELLSKSGTYDNVKTPSDSAAVRKVMGSTFLRLLL